MTTKKNLSDLFIRKQIKNSFKSVSILIPLCLPWNGSSWRSSIIVPLFHRMASTFSVCPRLLSKLTLTEITLLLSLILVFVSLEGRSQETIDPRQITSPSGLNGLTSEASRTANGFCREHMHGRTRKSFHPPLPTIGCRSLNSAFVGFFHGEEEQPWGCWRTPHYSQNNQLHEWCTSGAGGRRLGLKMCLSRDGRAVSITVKTKSKLSKRLATFSLKPKRRHFKSIELCWLRHEIKFLAASCKARFKWTGAERSFVW